MSAILEQVTVGREYNVGLGTVMRSDLMEVFGTDNFKIINTTRGTPQSESRITTIANREGADWVIQQTDKLFQNGAHSGDQVLTEIKFREVEGKWLARVWSGGGFIANSETARNAIKNVLMLTKPEYCAYNQNLDAERHKFGG